MSSPRPPHLPQETDALPELVTVREVADKLKLSVATIYRRPWRYVKDGGARRYYAEDIRLYLALNTVTPKPKPE